MKKGFLLLPVMAILLIIWGTLSCQSDAGSPTGKKSIVTTYSVLGSIVKELAGDAADVYICVPDGLDPHDWEPSARDIEAINKAGLVVINGLGLEENLQRALDSAQAAGVDLFVAADHIAVRYVEPDEDLHAEDHDHPAGAADPHLWMDPVAMKEIVRALSAKLKTDFGLDVSSRAADMQERLDELDREIAGLVSALPAEDRKLVTGHESLGYFADRYDFSQIGVIVPGLSSQAGVSAAGLAELKAAIEKNHVKAIFTEIGTPSSVTQTIGAETGARVVEITTHALPGDGSYFTFMRNIANTIINALK